jgi:hypothetical protein
MRICVQKRDIAKGVRRNVFDCPIACALKRRFDTSDVQVATMVATVEARTCRLPMKARKFIRAFDAGRTVEPFCFAFPMNRAAKGKA